MFSRVMLALDLSELTPRMLDVFYSICLDPETEVYLLHVVKKAENFARSSAYYKKTYSRLNGLAQDIQKAGYDNVEILWESNPDVLNGIQKAVDQYDINLLLMASHGKGIWASTFRGSNTFNAVRAIDIPTLVVKGDYKCSDYLQRILLPTDFSRKSLIALNFIRNLRENVGEVIFVHVIEGVRGDDELLENKEIAAAYEYVKRSGKALHFMGLTSHGGVHSSLNHSAPARPGVTIRYSADTFSPFSRIS